METVEHFAKIALVTHLLGHEQPLGAKEVEKLFAVRDRYNGGGKTPSAKVTVAGNHQHPESESKEPVGPRR
jgi:hypothetical protein